MATSITWPLIGGVSYSIPAAGEVGWPALSNFLIALQNAQGTDAQQIGTRTAVTSPVTVASATDCLVLCKLTVPAAVTVNLPAGVEGQLFVIADGTGDANTNNVTINRSGAETINGATSLVITNPFGSYTLVFRGTNWTIMSSYSSYLDGVTSAIQTQLNAKQALDATLTALAAYNTNGFLVQTAADTFAGRTITAGSAKITIGNGSGVAANPTVDVAEASLTLDNIGGTLGIAKGGTGQATQTAGFDALSPGTTKGDIIVHNGTDNIRVAVGADGTVLTANSGAASGLSYTAPLVNPMTTAGDIIVGGVAGAAGRLALGTTSHVYQSNGTTVVSALIVNANIDAAAAIAGTKISPNFGAQNILTTGTLGAGVSTFTSWTISAGSAANFSGWVAAAVLRMRGGTSGFAIDNTSAAQIFGGTDAGALTLGPSAGDTQHLVNKQITFSSSSAFVTGTQIWFNSNTLKINGGTSGIQFVSDNNSVQLGASTNAGLWSFNSGVILGSAGTLNTTSDANLGTIASVTDTAHYEGTFLITLTGAVTISDQVIKYQKHGKQVTLMWPAMQGTSTVSTSLIALNAIPSALRPGTDFVFSYVLVIDTLSGGDQTGSVYVRTNGTISFARAGGANFGINGTVGPYAGCISYLTS